MPSRSKKKQLRLNVLLGASAVILLAAGIVIGKCLQKEEASAVFVQQAVTGSLRPADIENGTYLLTLIGVKPHTLIFTDEPTRMAGSWTNTDFVTRWSQDVNGFKTNSPKAVLLSHSTVDGKEYSIAVKLSDPVFDGPGGWVSYTATILDEMESGLAISADRHMDAFPEILRSPALFIDTGVMER